jgi:hypothetical protein
MLAELTGLLNTDNATGSGTAAELLRAERA